MKKYFYIVGVVLVTGILTLYCINLLWKGWYEKGIGSTISLQLNNNKILISSKSGIMSPALKVSYIDNEINQDKKEVYIRIYSKFYSWQAPLKTSNNEVILTSTGSYKVFYRNPDGTNDFIKEIEYK